MNKEEFNNEKALGFFGKSIVDKLEVQHQDGYPNYFKRTYYNQFIFGDIAEYIVPFEGKEYKVIVEDNVMRDPLFINQITSWEEV